MFKKTLGCLVVVGLMLYPASYAFAGEPAWWTQMKNACRSSGGRPVSEYYNDWVSGGGCVCPGSSSGSGQPTCPRGSSSSGSSGSSSRDYEAERRAQEQADAARRAEEERQAELERQRIEAENRRIQEEKERQEKFIRDRDTTPLRGSSGMTITPNKWGGSQLRGTSTQDTGLRDALNDTGLRGSNPTSNKDQGKQAAAWKQLHCASYIAGFALKALSEKGDYQEYGTLSVEAMKALDGQNPGVVCPSAPAMPMQKSGEVDMEKLQGRERQVLEKAAKIAESMKQADAKKPEAETSKPAPPTNETDLEKKIRVQKELNRINSQKASNDQQEKERKELARLLLVNSGLEKGELLDVIAVTTEEAPKPKGQKRGEPPSPKAR